MQNQNGNGNHPNRNDFTWLDDKELIEQFRLHYKFNQHQDRKGTPINQRIYNKLYFELQHRGYKPEEHIPGKDNPRQYVT